MAPQNALQAEIKRAEEKLCSLSKLRPDVAANFCRDIVAYEAALRFDRNSMESRLQLLRYCNKAVGGNHEDTE